MSIPGHLRESGSGDSDRRGCRNGPTKPPATWELQQQRGPLFSGGRQQCAGGRPLLSHSGDEAASLFDLVTPPREGLGRGEGIPSPTTETTQLGNSEVLCSVRWTHTFTETPGPAPLGNAAASPGCHESKFASWIQSVHIYYFKQR